MIIMDIPKSFITAATQAGIYTMYFPGDLTFNPPFVGSGGATISPWMAGLLVGYGASLAADGVTSLALGLDHPKQRLERMEAMLANSVIAGTAGIILMPLLNENIFGTAGVTRTGIFAAGAIGEASGLVISNMVYNML